MLIILIIVLILALGGGGWGYSQFGWIGLSPAGLLLVIFLLLWLTGHLNMS